MRLVTVLPVLAVAASSFFVARARHAPRELCVRAFVQDELLSVHGELTASAIPWLAPAVHLYSTARDGALGLVRVAAYDANGDAANAWQESAASGASSIVVAGTARRVEFAIRLDSLVSGNTSVGYASEDGSALALPIRRFLFGAGEQVKVSAKADAEHLVAPTWLDRGLYLAGSGWRRLTSHTAEIFVGPGVPEESGARVSALVGRALERLREAGLPPPAVTPGVLLIECARRSAFARFDLPVASEIYVIPCRDGIPLDSGVLRDLAAAASSRLAQCRPSAEAVLWHSLEGPLAVQLARAVGLRCADTQVSAATRGYVGSEPVHYAPAITRNTTDAFYWYLREYSSVFLWERFFDDLQRLRSTSWSSWCSAITKDKRVDVIAATRSEFGEETAARFLELMYHDQWQLPLPTTAEAESFPVQTAVHECDGSDSASNNSSRIVLAITGLNLGFLDNCGCTRNQGGGAGRRKTLLDEQRTNEPETVLIDVGDTLAPPFSMKSRDEADASALLRVLKATKYDVLIPGISELAYDASWLQRATQDAGISYCTANVVNRTTKQLAFVPTTTLDREGRKVHILGLTEIPYERYFVPAVEARVDPQYELRDVVDCARAILASAQPQETWVLAGTITPESTKRLLSSDVADRIDAIVTGSWRIGRLLSSDPTTHSNTYLRHPDPGLYATANGMTAYFFNDRERHGFALGYVGMSATGTPLHAHADFRILAYTVERDQTVDKILADHASQQAGDPATWPLTPMVVHPEEQRPDAGYAGAAACGRCHKLQYSQWRSTRHSRALNELAGVAQENDVACLKCHTTGFHWQGGFEPGADTSHSLENVQCEVCHGPGMVHLRRFEQQGFAGIPDTIRRVPKREICLTCHDEENSPGFRFEDAIKKVTH